MADDPEALRQQGLDAVAAIDEMLLERQARLQAGELSATVSDTPAPALRDPEPRQRTVKAPTYPGVDWDATRRWVEALIDNRVGKSTDTFVTDVTAAIAGEAGDLIAGLRREFKTQLVELRTEFDRRLVELQHRAEVAALERRLAEAEQRAASGRPQDAAPSRPKLIGSADAA